MLDYSEDKGCYVVPLTKDKLENAPAYDLKDLIKHDGRLGDIREKVLLLLQCEPRLAMNGHTQTNVSNKSVCPQRVLQDLVLVNFARDQGVGGDAFCSG